MILGITKRCILIGLLVIFGFVTGIYLQDVKHEESTTVAWEANRFNMTRFDKIMDYTNRMNSTNWKMMRDSILDQTDSLMILRFRKEMDSLTKVDNPVR
ncbi:hypothetical protein ACFQZJ_07695 [Maribacter chungangensis]|uniref:Uncharacterized protein n=1 Tax=Maribacter chungangensis TaxID=1069117 RepID=A0ABW3B3I1_9FLAO